MPGQTENAIIEAFLRLLDEKPFSKITVKDIVQECGINRNTFYYHYADIPALLEAIMKAKINDAMREHISFDTIEKCFAAVTQCVLDNRRAMLHIYRSIKRDVFETYLMKACDYAVSKYFASAFKNVIFSEEEVELLRHLCTCAFFGVQLEWIEKGMQQDIKASLHQFLEMEKRMEEYIRSKDR